MGHELVGDVTQELEIEHNVMQEIGWGKFLADCTSKWIEIETKREPIEFKEEEKVTFLTSRRAQGQKTLHEKLFKCDNCDKCFARKDVLERHKGTVHEGKKPFKCSICNTGFSRKDFLTRHISTLHGKIFCEICKATFTQRASLKRHASSVHDV